MLSEKIEELRTLLNEMVISENMDQQKLLELSKELDRYIVMFIYHNSHMNMKP